MPPTTVKTISFKYYHLLQLGCELRGCELRWVRTNPLQLIPLNKDVFFSLFFFFFGLAFLSVAGRILGTHYSEKKKGMALIFFIEYFYQPSVIHCRDMIKIIWKMLRCTGNRNLTFGSTLLQALTHEKNSSTSSIFYLTNLQVHSLLFCHVCCTSLSLTAFSWASVHRNLLPVQFQS